MTLSRDLTTFTIQTRFGVWHFYLCATSPIQATIATAYEGDLAYCASDQKLYIYKPSGWVEVGGAGGGAPTGAQYLTGATDSTLTAERVVTDTATVTWDLSTAGQAKANVPGGAFEAAGAITAHVALSDPHTQYALESALGALASLSSVGTGEITADAVTNAKLANVATATLKGRTSSGTGDPEDLTTTQATALLDLFTSTLKGLVPSSGGGTSNFLRADGSWAAPSGGSGGLTLTVVEKDLGSLPRLSGTFDITGLSGLTTDRPVLMQQAVGPYTGKGTLADEAEMDQLSLSATVLNPSTIRAYWSSPTLVVGNFKFQYAVG
jgi:hypothetical protein